MKKKKRLFAILLALCVTFTMMPLTGSGGVAHAEDEIAATMQPTRTTMLDLTSTDEKYIATDGKENTVNFTTTSVTDSAEGWSWNHETKTLTLSGARIVVTEPTFVPSSYSTLKNGYYYGVRLPGAVTVVLTAETENIIQAGDVAGETPEGIVIGSVGMGDANDLQKSVTICGSGKLTVKGGKPAKGGNTAGRISEGIYSGKVIVKDSAELEVYGDMTENTGAAAYSRGIGWCGHPAEGLAVHK
ncbi:fibronectin type III domain [Firmicutes bacterium CAG:238]|nr:fibronectin type III domain [Firmicutes bacterium CAG:238]